MQKRYIKWVWVIVLERTTTKDIVLEEVKRAKLRIEVEKKLTKFE